MSTRTDRNFFSFDREEQSDATHMHFQPSLLIEWPPGSWQDTVKFYRRKGCVFRDFTVIEGGVEDAVDISPECVGNSFVLFSVNAGGAYVLTLKGGSCMNLLSEWRIGHPGAVVDIEIGNWSSTNFQRCTGNVFQNWSRADGKPVTYCYRFGCKPQFIGTKTRHLWWRSIGLTVYWCAKYLWHVKLGRADK